MGKLVEKYMLKVGILDKMNLKYFEIVFKEDKLQLNLINSNVEEV